MARWGRYSQRSWACCLRWRLGTRRVFNGSLGFMGLGLGFFKGRSRPHEQGVVCPAGQVDLPAPADSDLHGALGALFAEELGLLLEVAPGQWAGHFYNSGF